MSKLVNLLKDLGGDAALSGQYADNPDAVMDKYGLSADERNALKAGDLDQIKSMSGLQDVRMTTNSTIKSYDR